MPPAECCSIARTETRLRALSFGVSQSGELRRGTEGRLLSGMRPLGARCETCRPQALGRLDDDDAAIAGPARAGESRQGSCPPRRGAGHPRLMASQTRNPKGPRFDQLKPGRISFTAHTVPLGSRRVDTCALGSRGRVSLFSTSSCGWAYSLSALVHLQRSAGDGGDHPGDQSEAYESLACH